jgi:PKD repeat protein
VAIFTLTGDNKPAPCEVSFSNSSINATAYLWDFGDGSISTEQNPKHTYLVGGTFTVKLTAKVAGGSNSTTKSVSIQNPIPASVANFTLTGDNNFASCKVTFTNTSTNAVSYT